ncbi:MAG TPA: hypothetical protein VEQ42_08735 [Pyrinomonadaceae bacterium]|nr:hypothetical protein [Pyrinomonadaceae bacterium]
MIRKKLGARGEEDRRALQYASVEGEEVDAALRVLRTHPVPVVEWKTYALLSASDARTRATKKAREDLRETFLNSPPVREVLARVVPLISA